MEKWPYASRTDAPASRNCRARSGRKGRGRSAAGATAGCSTTSFDLLHLDGFDLTNAAIEDRKDLLRRLLARVGQGGRILYSEHIAGNGPAVLEQACRLGLEGIVSKRSSSPYRPGVRGKEWVKTKCKNEQEFVIGGYTEPAGARTGFGALLVGVRERRRSSLRGQGRDRLR